MKLSNNFSQAMLDTENILKDKKNIQVKFQVKRNSNIFETINIEIQKPSSRRIEKLKSELVKRFPDKQFDEIHLIISTIKPRKVNCPGCNKSMCNFLLRRHLKTCIKDNFCPICQKDFTEGLNKHLEECRFYPCNVCGKKFSSAVERTLHEKTIKNLTVKADFGRFKIIEIDIPPTPDYRSVLENKVNYIADILRHELETSLRFYISPKVEINGKHELSRFLSPATVLTKAEIIEEEVKTHCNIVLDKIEKQIGSSPEIKSIDIMIAKNIENF